MLLDTHKVYSGFKILRTEFIEEVNSQGYIMEHSQSGAKLVYLANDDDNKVFTIGFRTPPADDTGIAHIMEHSTLCGSRKYHLKEPFVELVKGSLNTFLNAMTYPDKTVYPVASRNDKDFANLMDVYLDAVFYPLIYENKYTLKQEGWHFETTAPSDPLAYNGVVYNEMKGVYSTPDALLNYYGAKVLFPDTPYRFESGGLPEAIPNLTQAAFEKFHQTYYSPENSYIYLYGDLDIEQTLAHLNEYLKDFKKTGKVNSEIPLEPMIEFTSEVNETYPVGTGEDTQGKTFLELQIVAGESTDFKTTLALKLLETVLLESESSPLRRALLDAGVGKDISGSFEASLRQPIITIRASGSEPKLKEKFIQVIYRTLQKLSRQGLDKQLLEAALNYLEFNLREADFGTYPKGLIFGLGVFDSWIYGADPLKSLQYNELLQELRAELSTRYFESLIETYLMDNSHKALIMLEPEPGKENKQQAAEQKKLAELKQHYTEQELQQFAKECQELHARQGTQDSAEALASIPLLKRTDIRRKVEIIPRETEQVQGGKYCFVPLKTNKITYINWSFDVTGIAPDLLPYCNLLSDVLGRMDTDEYTYAELSKYTSMYTGGVSYELHAMSAPDDCNEYQILFNLRSKALTVQVPKLFKILTALTLHMHFDDVARFKELVGSVTTDWDNNFFSRGQDVAKARLASYFSKSACVDEKDYLSYYQFLKDLTADLDAKAPEVLQKLQQVIKLLFNKTKFFVTYSCEAKDRENIRQQIMNFMDALPESPVAGQKALPVTAPGRNEGVQTPGKVQYVTAGGNFRIYGQKYTGAMQVLATLLRYEYLWTRIRIQGGAYGANATFGRNGEMILSTYRDPQLTASLKAFQELPAWLSKLTLTEREMTKYVIGTISGLDTPLTNSLKIRRVTAQELMGLTTEARQQTRNEVLDVKVSDLQALAEPLSKVLADNYLCVVGGQQPIEDAKKIFNKTFAV
jgi:Zn-dependent M16 (insulinase) family peptidase